MCCHSSILCKLFHPYNSDTCFIVEWLLKTLYSTRQNQALNCSQRCNVSSLAVQAPLFLLSTPLGIISVSIIWRDTHQKLNWLQGVWENYFSYCSLINISERFFWLVFHWIVWTWLVSDFVFFPGSNLWFCWWIRKSWLHLKETKNIWARFPLHAPTEALHNLWSP